MKRLAIALLPLFGLLWAYPAAAQQFTYQRSTWVQVGPRPEQPSIFAEDTQVRRFGISVLVGLPEGLAPALTVRPFDTNALHVDLGPSGALSLGFRGGVTWDPFDWVVAPTLTVAGGYHSLAEVPGTNDVNFTAAYLNIQPGLEIGRRSRFRILLRVGYTRLWIQTQGLDGKAAKKYAVTIDAPSVVLDVLPSITLGLTAYL